MIGQSSGRGAWWKPMVSQATRSVLAIGRLAAVHLGSPTPQAERRLRYLGRGFVGYGLPLLRTDGISMSDGYACEAFGNHPLPPSGPRRDAAPAVIPAYRGDLSGLAMGLPAMRRYIGTATGDGRRWHLHPSLVPLARASD